MVTRKAPCNTLSNTPFSIAASFPLLLPKDYIDKSSPVFKGKTESFPEAKSSYHLEFRII